jgi:periplasmic protein CpxP/Spy
MATGTIDAVTTELKRIAQSLNLSDAQKEQLRTFLTEKHAKLQEFKQQNPNISRNEIVQKVAAIRTSLREQAVKFLTPQQLEKWDAEVAKAREFLGHNLSQ